ncbi:MAG: L-type lectin-domain containing protein, partial [Bacteroidota bacterium]
MSGQYTLNGGALNNGGNCFSITPNSSWQLGSVWNNSLLDLSTDFDIQFSMNLGTQDGNGADGIVFVLQQQGLNAIGSSGSGLGFQGLMPSLGIEFDTFQNNIPSDPMNNSNDPFADHCAIFKNGIVNHSSANQLAGPVNISASNVNIEDGLNHNVRIVWNAMQQNLQVFIDCTLRLDLTHNLVSNIFNGNSNVYWGFTGSTGGLFNNQTVCLPQNIIGEINLPLVCQGSAVNLSAPTNAYTNLNWEPANLVATPNATNTTAIINGYTEFQLTFEDICGITYAYTYIADITPGIEIELPPDSALCFGEPLELNAIILGNYTNFNWYGTVGTSLSPNNSLSPTINGAGTYQLFVEGVNGCNYNESFTLTNLPTPSVQWPAITEFCPGDTLVITPEINAQFWSWQNGSTDSSFSAFETQTLTLSMSTGNCTVSSTLDVTELIPIQLDLGPDQVHCEGEIIELTSPIAGLWNGGSFGTNFALAATSTIIFSGTDQTCPVIDTLLITFE